MKLYSGGILILILCFSTKLKNVEYRVVFESVKISAQRVSPAFAVLEDSFLMEDGASSQMNFFNEVHIKSGEQKIARMNLEGLTVKRSQSLKIASQVSRVAMQTKNLIRKIQVPHVRVDSGNRSSLIPRKNFSLSLSQIIKAPTNSIHDKKVVLSAKSSSSSPLTASNPMGSRKEIQVDGASFIVGSPTAALNPMTISSWRGQRETQRQKKKRNGALRRSHFASAPLNSLTTTSAVATNILGRIQLADGAVLPGEEFSFYIQRVFDDMTQERGEINSETGEFGITVGELRGKLLVELRHYSGVVIAFGESHLVEGSQRSIKDVVINVRPAVDESFVGRVISYESFDDHEISTGGRSNLFLDGDFERVKTNEKGYFLDSQIATGSQVLISASHKGFWNSLQIAETGQPIQPILHSDKHMRAFLQLLEPHLGEEKIHSVIWGRVSHQGQPVAGADVHLLGFEDIRPWYFELRIPNSNLEKTSGDGFFAFVNPPEGLHIVKARVKDLTIPLETTVVRGEHTSVVRLETAPKKPVKLYSYEAFNSETKVSGRVSTPGVDTSWRVGHKTFSSVPFYDRPTSMVINVDPLSSKYLPTRFFVGRRRAMMRIPNISRDWLDNLLARQKVNSMPRTGVIIGFIDGGKHSVDLGSLESSSRVIYFNSKGRSVQSLTEGGGFVLANVPLGVISTNIKNIETEKILKRLFFVEPHRVNITQVSNIY